MRSFYFLYFLFIVIKKSSYNFVVADSGSCLYLNGENTCHETCEECNQCGDPKSCISCPKDQFKISPTYYDAVFECSENCENLSKEIHGKNYFYCTPSKNAINKNTETTDLQKHTAILNSSTNYLNIDTNFILIILVSVLILIVLCFGGIALSCYVCHLSFPPTPAATRTTDFEITDEMIATFNDRMKAACDQPLIHPPHRFHNAVIYKNLEILNSDNYKLGDVIGGGSYSRVYEGELDGKHVAIKMALREGRKSIHKELQIYDKVSHPHILPALGVHLAVENLLFMPLRKFSLADFFIDYGAIIQNNKLLRYCIQISSALKYLHEKNILHCDIKVDNILMKDDDGEEVEISDFGCAIDLAHDREARYNGTITHTSYELLKDYINPEMKQKGTKASDVWAFSVTVWQIYKKSGRIPNDFISPREIINNYERGKKLPKPEEMPERMWRYILLQCFDLQPQGRPTMKEIYERLTTDTF